MNVLSHYSLAHRSLLLLMVGMLLSTAHTVNSAQPDDSPVSVSRAGAHRFMIQGDQARDRRQWAEAIRSYQAAMEIFRVVGADAPAWDQDYYSFREEYSRREIRLIERQTGRTAEAWLETVETLTAADAERYRLLYHAMQRENQQLRERVEELEDDLELMLEMEELDRQRQRTIIQRRESLPGEPEPEFNQPPQVIEAIPTQPIPATDPERSILRRRAPNDPVPRR